jgi:flagellar biosynthesis protein FlhF
MRLKSYFASTVEEAMDLARRELGEEALLVNARPATKETRSLGAFEVVFGTVEEAPPPAVAAPRPSRALLPAPTEEAMPQAAETLQNDVAILRREMESMAQSMRILRNAHSAATAHNPAVYTSLTDAELDPDLAYQIANGTPLESMILVDPSLGRAGATRRVVMLVGPPGAGKTSALVKLAASFGLSAKRPAHIVTTDVQRIAAADQLRTLAAILGIGCTVAETTGALAQALEEHRNKGFIFIDTPGFSPAEMAESIDLAAYARASDEIDVHLVLPATLKAADMTGAAARYEIFRPHKLIFTRIDETSRYGAVISESARRQWPVSFLSTGQQIPEDLEPASKARLGKLLTSASSAPMLLSRALKSRGATA